MTLDAIYRWKATIQGFTSLFPVYFKTQLELVRYNSVYGDIIHVEYINA